MLDLSAGSQPTEPEPTPGAEFCAPQRVRLTIRVVVKGNRLPDSVAFLQAMVGAAREVFGEDREVTEGEVEAMDS